MTDPAPDLPHIVYRFWDANDRLLYVGCTSDLNKRLQDHRRKRPWWNDVATITHDKPRRKFAALAAERRAIRAESPLHNVVGNPNAMPPEQRHPDLVRAIPARSSA